MIDIETVKNLKNRHRSVEEVRYGINGVYCAWDREPHCPVPELVAYIEKMRMYVAHLSLLAEIQHPLGVSQDDCNDECLTAEAIRTGKEIAGPALEAYQRSSPIRLPVNVLEEQK